MAPQPNCFAPQRESAESISRKPYYGLKAWIEAAKKRMHHNVLAIALANKLARIAWAVLNKERNFECVRRDATAPQSA